VKDAERPPKKVLIPEIRPLAMKKNAVFNKIRLLKNIEPNPDWLESQRRNLLLHIKSDNEAQRAWSLSEFFVPRLAGAVSKLALKPVMVSLIIFCLIFGGGFLSVLAAKNSLPGDLLYPIKIAVENARIKVSSSKSQINLQAEFVGNRAEELSQIIEKPGDIVEKKEKVAEAADKLQEQIVGAKNHLDKISQSKPEKMIEVAEVLVKAKEKLIEDLGEGAPEEVVKIIDQTTAIILLSTKKQAEEIKGKVEALEATKPEQAEGPIITTPDQVTPLPINDSINEASETFENLEK